MTTTTDTLGKMIDLGYGLYAYCAGPCWHSAKLDMAMLTAKLGRDFEPGQGRLARKLRCIRCNGKSVSIRLDDPAAPKMTLYGPGSSSS